MYVIIKGGDRMKINFKVRLKNRVFIVQIILAIILPVLSYAGMTYSDLTTWESVGNLIVMAVSNPYVLGLTALSVFNALTDPTTAGITDSDRAMSYEDLSTRDN